MAGWATAQDASSVTSTDTAKAHACNNFALQTTETLNFEQRLCWYRNRIAAPTTALKGAFVAAFGQWRNSPWVPKEDLDDISTRLGFFYARRTGQYTGEFLAGYFHSEDPRPHLSLEHGVWKRSRAALLSVVVTPDEDGGHRMALLPIAGSLGSGLTGGAFYNRMHDPARVVGAIGFTYSTYFANALLREFQPDVSAFATRFLHR